MTSPTPIIMRAYEKGQASYPKDLQWMMHKLEEQGWVKCELHHAKRVIRLTRKGKKAWAFLWEE